MNNWDRQRRNESLASYAPPNPYRDMDYPKPNNSKCNRTACSNPHSWWWNKATEAFYCFQCMKMIIQYPENKDLFELKEPIKELKIKHRKDL